MKTPYDKYAYIRVYAKTDLFMELLMKELYGEEFDLSSFAQENNEKIEKFEG